MSQSTPWVQSSHQFSLYPVLRAWARLTRIGQTRSSCNAEATCLTLYSTVQTRHPSRVHTPQSAPVQIACITIQWFSPVCHMTRQSSFPHTSQCSQLSTTCTSPEHSICRDHLLGSPHLLTSLQQTMQSRMPHPVEFSPVQFPAHWHRYSPSANTHS